MNANKIISIIHITLVGLIIFLTLSFIILFIVLQNGIVIEKIHFSSIKAAELYIKWNEKLSVKLGELEISTNSSDKETTFDLDTIETVLKDAKLFLTLFETITLPKIHVNNINGSFRYARDDNGYLNATSPSFELSSTLYFQNNKLHVNLQQFRSKDYNTTIDGNLTLDIESKNIHSKLQCKIGSDASLHIDANATTDAVYFNITSKKPIKNLLKAVDHFELDPTIKFWAIENINAPSYSLQYLKGIYRFKHPEKFITELDAKAYLPKMAYSFSKKLAPIKTEHTNLHFKDGVLHIRPYNGMFKHHNLPKSYLDIDFSKPQFHLNAYIITNTILDDDILKILDTYKIRLPLKQSSGTTQTNLKLDINLHTLETKADGTFKVDKGTFLFKNEILHVKNMALQLRNSHVEIDQAVISYAEYIDADVQGYIDPVKNRADLKIRPKRIGINNLKLDTSKLLLNANYKLSPKKETLSLERSQWIYDDKTITVDAFDAPFNFNDFSLKLPHIGIALKDNIHANISGTVNISKLYANINVTVNQLKYNNIKLLDENVTLNFNYDKELLIQTEKFSHFQYSNQNIKIAPLQLNYHNHRLQILKSKFYIKDLVDFQLQGEYLTQSQKGLFQLDYIRTHPQDLYVSNDELNITYKKLDGNTIFNCPTLAISALISSKGWWVTLPELSKTALHSPLLQNNFITDGNMTIHSTNKNKAIQFNGTINYPYALLVEGNHLQNIYQFNGSFDDNVTQLHINENIHVNIADIVTINTEDVGFNIPAIVELLENTEESKPSDKTINISAKNSFLYLSQHRRALIDSMYLYKNGNTVFATLTHKQGKARFELNDDNTFHLYGDHFNDLFMNNLLALAEHQHGSLYFYIYGDPKSFQGILKVKNTILKDYKVINNMLAFVNTVPALSTFSLPQYSSKGLHVKKAYGGFTYKNKNITIHDASLDSKELRIHGNGDLNFAANTISMKLSLKTDLGTTLSKLPIVGYLLFGDDGSVSTTITIDGKLDNPTVSNAIAKDIAVAPFRLLKRTLLLPVHLIKQVQ